MSAEKNLDTLLTTLSPLLLADEYVFCTFSAAQYGDHAQLRPVASFIEAEGLSLVIPKQQAIVHHIPYETTFRAITLTVHSSLDAVGLTAAVATKLAAYGISANVIAAYFHDHIFVQTTYAEQAVAALGEFAS